MKLHLDDRDQFIKLKGREVYKFAVHRFEELIHRRDAEMRIDHRSGFADRSASIEPADHRIRDGQAEHSAGKAFVNLDKYGNTSAASVPIALDEARRTGRIESRDRWCCSWRLARG